MIVFIPWKYRGKPESLEILPSWECQFEAKHLPKNNLSNFSESFLLKVLYLLDSEIKLEPLSTHVSSCPFFTIKVLKHTVLGSFIPCPAELPGLFSRELLFSRVCYAGSWSSTFRALAAPGLLSPLQYLGHTGLVSPRNGSFILVQQSARS